MMSRDSLAFSDGVLLNDDYVARPAYIVKGESIRSYTTDRSMPGTSRGPSPRHVTSRWS